MISTNLTFFGNERHQMVGPDCRCFLAAWVVSLFIGVKDDRPKPNLSKRKGIHHRRMQRGGFQGSKPPLEE